MIQEWRLPIFPLMKIILYHKPFTTTAEKSNIYCICSSVCSRQKPHLHIFHLLKRTLYLYFLTFFECWVGGLFNHKYVSEWAASRSGNVAPHPHFFLSQERDGESLLMREDRGCLFMSSILTPLLFYNWTKSNVPSFSWQICWYFWGKWSLIGCQCCSRQKLVKSPESPTFLFRHCQLKGQNSKSMLPHHFTCQF